MTFEELYIWTYLSALAVAGLAALFRRDSALFAICMALDFLATMALQKAGLFPQMMVADAFLFSSMGLLCVCEPKRETIIATALIGLSVLAHVAYYSLGDARFEVRYVHMYGEQALFLLAMAALAVGDDNVFQRLSRHLDRWSHDRGGRRNHAAGPVWIRSGASSPLPEETT